MEVLLFLLLPVAALSGWIIGRKGSQSSAPNFFASLDFEVSHKPDPAIDLLVDMPEIDDDAVDTHLTLGNIFRKRGELERAIRLHQGLLQRNSLSVGQKAYAQLELAKDYVAAGVHDRAETLLLELISNRLQMADSLQHLLDLYQRGKEWLSAINVAEKLQSVTTKDLHAEIAHFYCELAEQALKTSNIKQAKVFLKNANSTHRDCGRALILRANIAQHAGQFAQAIKLYKHIAAQDVDYFPLIINDLIKCYQMVNVKSRAFDLAQVTHNSTQYRCDHCGFEAKKLQWHCPSCRKWDAIKPIPVS